VTLGGGPVRDHPEFDEMESDRVCDQEYSDRGNDW